MKKLAVLAALACALAAMSSVAYACNNSGCATEDEATTPAAKAPAAVARVQVAAPCGNSDCATPELEPTQIAKTPEGNHPARATASMSPAAAAALSKAAKAIKDKIQQRTGCNTVDC